MLIVFGGQLMLHIIIQKKYNLSVAFRLGWTQHIKIIFFIPVALMGFDPVLFFYVIKLIPLSILDSYRIY
jgi:hypothetical protein